MPGLFVLLAIVLGSQVLGPWGAILGVPIVAFLYSLVTAWAGLHPLGAPAEEETDDRQDAAQGDGRPARAPAREQS